MPEIFTWKNCWADIHTYRYGAIAQEFLAHVANPSLDALDAQVAEHRKSDDPISEFYISEFTELINKTRMAFCLSIQSLWEQQIRAYLHGCQKQLGINPFPISAWKKNETIHSATWGRELDTVFLRLRGIPLTIFASYKSLICYRWWVMSVGMVTEIQASGCGKHPLSFGRCISMMQSLNKTVMFLLCK